MFDVLWTDPNRELVGDRIVRKEQESKVKDKGKDKKNDTNRNSVSTHSSSSSERAFGIFGSKNRKKPATISRFKISDTPPEDDTLEDMTDRSVSSYGVSTLLSHEKSEATAKPINGEAMDGSRSLSSRDSGLSKWNPPSLATSSTLAGSSHRNSIVKSEHWLQTLGPSSFVTKSTEITLSPRNSESDIDRLISETHISSDRTKADTPPLPELPKDGTPVAFEASDAMILSPCSPQTPPPVDVPSSTYMLSWNCNDRVGNPESWKPPHEWDCSSIRETPTSSFEERMQMASENGDDEPSLSPDSGMLQREIRMMAAATPELMLANLKSTMGDSQDAMVYKELEMQKKRWMFSALHKEDLYAVFKPMMTSIQEQNTEFEPRILAIYETQASASFLAARYPGISISHLSPNPISPALFPNVSPILVPAITALAASQPLPPQFYSAVTCLSMPALFPSPDVTWFLRKVNRCLAPGGALHLTVIDPQPVSSSMGPKLREWLFTKLLINLEKKYRTTFPTDTFKAWLAVAQLRGKGSTISTVSVPVIPEGIKNIPGVKGRVDSTGELRSLSTRMLWQEVWGSFVQAEKWWWEEPEIVEECIKLGTFWQYSHIVAIKEETKTSCMMVPTGTCQD